MKQERYLDKDGRRDWIDDCWDILSIEQFEGAMFFTIGKYYKRLGKKDPLESEQYKINDYRQRWIEKLGQLIGTVDATKHVNRSIEQAKEMANDV